MLRHIKHKDLDFQKYDTCIEQSPNGLIYALSWYLDVVAKERWDALVWGDYDAVMPLPYRRIKSKWFQQMIAQPPYCQQLGIFSKVKLTDVEVQVFIDELLKQKIYNYQLNSYYPLDEKIFSQRPNFELSLNADWESLVKGFSRRNKSSSNKKHEFSIIQDNERWEEFTQFKINELKVNRTAITPLIKRLTKTLIHHDRCRLFGIYYQEKLMGVTCITIFKNRYINLWAGSNAMGRSKHAMNYLLQFILKDAIGKSHIFDFEGSSIPGIADFFKSFGAENQPYYSIQS